MIQLIVRRSGESDIEDPLSKMSRTPEESVVSVLGRVKLRPQSSKVHQVLHLSLTAPNLVLRVECKRFNWRR